MNNCQWKINPLLQAIDNTLTPTLNGQYQPLSWQSLLADTKFTANAKRMVVIAKPIQYFDQMLPAAVSQDAAHAAIAKIVKDDPKVNIRITGEPALEHEELESVSTGAQLAGLLSLISVFVPVGRFVHSNC